MKHKLRFGFFLIFISLSACNLGKTIPTLTIPEQTDIPVSVNTPMPAPVNLALNKDADASNLMLAELPKYAVDGDLETQWGAGDISPQWIQLDLQSLATVSGIRLTIAQYPNGETVHQIFAGASSSDLNLVHEFSGSTADNQTLEFFFEIPLSGTRYIKVLTTESPSWVAWKEIEILGFAGGPLPTPRPDSQIADVIYFNGQIITMEKDNPVAEAIALKADKIMAVGSQSDVLVWQGDRTRMINLNGLTVTPGFIDLHSHRIGDRWHYGDVSAEDMMGKAISQGWTSLHELFVFDERLNELVDIANANAMPMRVSMYLTMNFDYSYDKWWQGYEPLQQYGSYLQIAGLKITLDREWGEQIFFDQTQLDQMIMDANADGWQVATHSFSPQANQMILDAYGKALNGGSNDQYRFRIEHTGVMIDAEVQQMADLGVIGSVQLINASSWVDDASFKKYIPAAEVQHSARWRDMLNAGVFLIGNTDDPWCCTDWRNGFSREPFGATVAQAIYQGVTRNTFFGNPVDDWQIAQAVTVQEALEMLTINGAYSAHQENIIGSLMEGKYADLVVLSENPLTVSVEEIPNIKSSIDNGRWRCKVLHSRVRGNLFTRELSMMIGNLAINSLIITANQFFQSRMLRKHPAISLW